MPNNKSRKNVRARAALVLAAVFVIGVVSGAAIWHLYMISRMPPPMHGPIPVHRLGLSDDQRNQVHAIFEAHRPELDKVLSGTFPKVKAINDDIEQEVMTILTPAQKEKLMTIKRERPKGPPHGRRPPVPHGPPHQGTGFGPPADGPFVEEFLTGPLGRQGGPSDKAVDDND